jgi:hypothetical protein
VTLRGRLSHIAGRRRARLASQGPTLAMQPWFSLLVTAAVAATVPAQTGTYFVNRQPINELNSPASANNFSPTLSEDELYVVFASDRPGGSGGFDLYEARRTSVNGTWSTPQPVPGLNSPENDHQPHLAYSGLELFFVSTRPGGQGVSDLYVTRRANVGAPWGPPQNLGAPLNAPGLGNEDPYLTQDGLTLYFSSNGAGGADVYTATRAMRGAAWGNKQAFAPANSTWLDHSPVPEGNGDVLYFASTRPGGAGSSDWYLLHRTGASSWSAPLLMSELNSASWDSSGWYGGVTRRFYSTSITSGTAQLYVASSRFEVMWFERFPMATLVAQAETVPQRTTWRRVYDLPFGAPAVLVRYYHAGSSPSVTTLLMSTQLATPLTPVTYFTGSLALSLGQLLVIPIGNTPSDGMIRLFMQLPPNPYLIGGALHWQAATVDLTTITGQLSEPATIRFVR